MKLKSVHKKIENGKHYRHFPFDLIDYKLIYKIQKRIGDRTTDNMFIWPIVSRILLIESKKSEPKSFLYRILTMLGIRQNETG